MGTNDDSDDDEEGDTTIEVPVDFEATAEEEPMEANQDDNANAGSNDQGDSFDDVQETSMIIEPETTLNEDPDKRDENNDNDQTELAQKETGNRKPADSDRKSADENSNKDLNTTEETDEQTVETEMQEKLVANENEEESNETEKVSEANKDA